MNIETQRESASNRPSDRGTACTPQEWAALAKIASGQRDISQQDMRRLFMLGLVERECGVVRLTRYGRTVLGSPE
jgi:hypothetical protein